MKSGRRMNKKDKSSLNNIKLIKMENPIERVDKEFLNKKRERRVKYKKEEKDDSNYTNTETNETTFKKKDDKRNAIKSNNSEHFKGSNFSKRINQRSNRFIRKPFIKLDNESTTNNEKNKKEERKSENNLKGQGKKNYKKRHIKKS